MPCSCRHISPRLSSPEPVTDPCHYHNLCHRCFATSASFDILCSNRAKSRLFVTAASSHTCTVNAFTRVITSAINVIAWRNLSVFIAMLSPNSRNRCSRFFLRCFKLQAHTSTPVGPLSLKIGPHTADMFPHCTARITD